MHYLDAPLEKSKGGGDRTLILSYKSFAIGTSKKENGRQKYWVEIKIQIVAEGEQEGKNYDWKMVGMVCNCTGDEGIKIYSNETKI